MSTFIAELSPSDTLCDELAALEPTIPYYTLAYRNALHACGRQVWLLGCESQGRLEYGCLAEIHGGRLRRRLHVQSTPTTASKGFWDGVQKLCRAERVTTLSLGTVGTNPTIAYSGRKTAQKERAEFWVDLTAEDLIMRLRPQQRRVYRKAVKHGLEVKVPETDDGLIQHRALTGESLGRRRERGEDIPLFDETMVPRALIEAGAARICECLLDGEVLGSVIFTVAKSGAHGYSAGYSRQGMKLGAGVFLNIWSFERLQKEGMILFNLGDAPPETGLATFKRGLGGQMHESESVTFDTSTFGKSLLIRVQNALAGPLRRNR